jgi:hypothetical protein
MNMIGIQVMPSGRAREDIGREYWRHNASFAGVLSDGYYGYRYPYQNGIQTPLYGARYFVIPTYEPTKQK